MKIAREWAMPNGDTFSIKPIRRLLNDIFRLQSGRKAIDPFARNSPFKKMCVTNDLDESVDADYHMDALDFLKSMPSNEFGIILFDPPYSVRQVSECYKKMGRTVNSETTRSDFWTKLKCEIQRISKDGAVCVSFGWNSGGVGEKFGFEISEILLVPHGGIHHDTIVTVEVKSAIVQQRLCP